MARERTIRDSYTGRAGQLAVMAELLLRGRNVAIPEVDEGEDVLAFQPSRPEITRIQVKTAHAELLQEAGRYAARVSVPLSQLEAEDNPELYYVFPIRLGEAWTDFVILSRQQLLNLSEERAVGYVNRRAGERSTSRSGHKA